MLATTPADAAPVLPAEGPVVVGLAAFNGPDTAQGIRASCLVDGKDDLDCISLALDELLAAKGSEFAFQALENMTLIDPYISEQGHPLAHGMGRTAVSVYGGPRTALKHCPYVLSSGCFHGVMQSYFDTLPSLSRDIVRGMCMGDDPTWQFQCIHGMGHGLMLYTNYAMNSSLEYCDFLDGWMSVESCQGGVIMENLVGYADSLVSSPGAGHNHGGTPRPPPTFMVRPDDPAFPCDVLAEKYLKTCYYFQSSVTLHFNGGNFPATVAMCQGAPATYYDVCFRSIGRDAGARMRYDPHATSAICLLGTQTQAESCIRGFAGDVVNTDSNPAAAIPACAAVDEPVRDTCFDQIGASASQMRGRDAALALCDTVPAANVDACRHGALA